MAFGASVLPSAVTDGIGSNGASSAFYVRLAMFVAITLYGGIAVAVSDAFWPQVVGRDPWLKEQPA